MRRDVNAGERAFPAKTESAAVPSFCVPLRSSGVVRQKSALHSCRGCSTSSCPVYGQVGASIQDFCLPVCGMTAVLKKPAPVCVDIRRRALALILEHSRGRGGTYAASRKGQGASDFSRASTESVYLKSEFISSRPARASARASTIVSASSPAAARMSRSM